MKRKKESRVLVNKPIVETNIVEQIAGPQIKLAVWDALFEDNNKGIVRIDPSKMLEANLRSGDIVEISSGSKLTTATAYKDDSFRENKNIIRMDRNTKDNCQSNIGKMVGVRKALVREAKDVVILPSKRQMIKKEDLDSIKDFLIKRPVISGDVVTIPKAKLGSGWNNKILKDDDLGEYDFLRFIVKNTLPSGVVQISKATSLSLMRN